MDIRIIIGLVIHGLILWVVSADHEMQVIAPFIAPFVLLNVAGMVLIVVGKVRAGCITYMVGAVAFVPIGLIGFLGARAMLDKVRRQAFAEGL